MGRHHQPLAAHIASVAKGTRVGCIPAVIGAITSEKGISHDLSFSLCRKPSQ
jgi:hypothetical protein